MTTQTRQQAYEARVLKFAEGKTFQYLTSTIVRRGDIRCDACGSKLVQELRLIQDNNGEYYLIGVNCHTVLYNEQRMKWATPFPNYKESQEIAEKLVAERRFSKYFIELTGDIPIFIMNNEFYPLQCVDCGAEISKADAIQYDDKCQICWHEKELINVS